MCVRALSAVLRLEPHVHFNMRARAGARVNRLRCVSEHIVTILEGNVLTLVR